MDTSNSIVEEDVTPYREEVEIDGIVVEFDPNQGGGEDLPDPLIDYDGQNNGREIEAPIIHLGDEDGNEADNTQNENEQDDDVIIIENENLNQNEARLEQIRQAIDVHLDSRLGLDGDNEVDKLNDPDYTPGRGIKIPKKQLKASTFKAKNIKNQLEKFYKKYDD